MCMRLNQRRLVPAVVRVITVAVVDLCNADTRRASKLRSVALTGLTNIEFCVMRKLMDSGCVMVFDDSICLK